LARQKSRPVIRPVTAPALAETLVPDVLVVEVVPVVAGDVVASLPENARKYRTSPRTPQFRRTP
jgi:hypothetical protein